MTHWRKRVLQNDVQDRSSNFPICVSAMRDCGGREQLRPVRPGEPQQQQLRALLALLTPPQLLAVAVALSLTAGFVLARRASSSSPSPG